MRVSTIAALPSSRSGFSGFRWTISQCEMLFRSRSSDLYEDNERQRAKLHDIIRFYRHLLQCCFRGCGKYHRCRTAEPTAILSTIRNFNPRIEFGDVNEIEICSCLCLDSSCGGISCDRVLIRARTGSIPILGRTPDLHLERLGIGSQTNFLRFQLIG